RGGCGGGRHSPGPLHRGGRQQQVGAEDLQEQARGGGAAHVGDAVVDGRSGGGGLAGGEGAGLPGEDLGAVSGGVDEPEVEGLGDGLEDHEVAEAFEEVLDEAAGVVARFDDVVDGGEQGGAVAGGEGVDGGVDK